MQFLRQMYFSAPANHLNAWMNYQSKKNRKDFI